MGGERTLHHTASAGPKAEQKNGFSSATGLVDRLPMNRQMRAKRNAKIRKRYANGETQKQIAKDYGLSSGAVSSICRGRDLDIEDKIRRRYANGEAKEKLAENYGLSMIHVSVICGKVERKQYRELDNIYKICERYANGETLKKIAEDYGVSQQTIGHICQAMMTWWKRISEYDADLKRDEDLKRDAEICKRRANGETQKKLAEDYGLPPGVVSYICIGVKTRLERERGKICERYANRETQKKIAEDYGVSQQTIGHICRGVERKQG